MAGLQELRCVGSLAEGGLTCVLHLQCLDAAGQGSGQDTLCQNGPGWVWDDGHHDAYSDLTGLPG